MKLSEALEAVGGLAPISVPELRYVQAAADRVRERWPDVQAVHTDKEREALAQKLRDRVERDDWADVRLSFVVSATSTVFDEERRAREDLASTREFLYLETVSALSETFLTGVLRAYLESYQPEAIHTKKLAAAIGRARANMSQATQLLLEALPEILDTKSGPKKLAARMSKMSDPYTELVSLGIRNPHGVGFMDITHFVLTETVKANLTSKDRIDWYIQWLRPPGKEEGRNTGAEIAIEGLIHPWLTKRPDDALQSHLVETLIELYGDPRIQSGGVWGGVEARCMAILQRWLTREDMRFFTGVVDATQNNAMWPPRRDFWLKLYDEGKIDDARAALSSEAFEYARQHLMRQDAQNAYSRLAYQEARQNTSLLIMKIGNKIMVDGCHSYRTHVFDAGDPMAPKLSEEGYNCDDIMRASDARAPVAAKSHSSIGSWSRWVRDMINADVPLSRQTRPYTRVFRPRPPRSRATRPFGQQSQYPLRNQMPRQQPANFAATGDRPTARPRAGASIFDAVDSSAGTPLRVSAANSRTTHSQSSQVQVSDNARQIRQRSPDSLADKLIAHGPIAADAILAFHDDRPDGATRPLLSPKAREGLSWISMGKGDLPTSLRNALDHMLLGLKRNGTNLDELMSKPGPKAPVLKSMTVTDARPLEDTKSQKEDASSISDYDDKWLERMRACADDLDELGMSQSTFQQRKASAIALRKLSHQTDELLAEDVMELNRLYGKLRESQSSRAT